MPVTIDSNKTGLRFAKETSIGVLPVTPDWLPLEPNSYTDFGGQLTTITRNPITASRQRKRGVVTAQAAAAGYEIDLTYRNTAELLEAELMSTWRRKANQAITAISGTAFEVADESDFAAGDLVHAQNVNTPANRALFVVTGTAAGEVQVTGLVAEVTPADAVLRKVGRQGASADFEIDATTDPARPRLTTTAFDLTDLGIIAGEWVYVGGDGAATKFATAANNGWARVAEEPTANEMVFDKTQGTMVTDAGTGKTIQLFIGDALRDEDDYSLVVKNSYTFERYDVDAGYQYVEGVLLNTATLAVPAQGKPTLAFAAVGIDAPALEVGARAGNRPTLRPGSLFNTSSNMSRLRILDESLGSILAHFTELNISINNNVNAVPVIGQLAAADVALGEFAVSGTLTGLFVDSDLIDAIVGSIKATLDMAFVRDNEGYLFDFPSITLGDGRLQVEPNQPIRVPVSMEMSADETLLHTMMVMQFSYLPDAAE